MRTIISILALTLTLTTLNAQPTGVTPYEHIDYTYTTRQQAISTNLPYSNKVIAFAETITGKTSQTTTDLRAFFANPTTDNGYYTTALELIKAAYSNDSALVSILETIQANYDLASLPPAPARKISAPKTEWENCLESARSYFPDDSATALRYAKETYETIRIHSDPAKLAAHYAAESEAEAKAYAQASRIEKINN